MGVCDIWSQNVMNGMRIETGSKLLPSNKSSYECLSIIFFVDVILILNLTCILPVVIVNLAIRYAAPINLMYNKRTYSSPMRIKLTLD